MSGNTLKLIAAAAMLLDHMGLLLFPGEEIFRILGRLALPIYAYMIAEGCKYTRSRRRYLGGILVLAAACQAVYYIADGTWYLSVLFTFSAAILTIYALQNLKRSPSLGRGLVLAGVVAGIWLLNRAVTVDYGFWGCMLPVFPAVFQDTPWDKKEVHVAMLGLGLVALWLAIGGWQLWSLAAVPLLLLYSGKRGKWKLKYFFYIFYPAHLAALQVVAWVIH